MSTIWELYVPWASPSKDFTRCIQDNEHTILGTKIFWKERCSLNTTWICMLSYIHAQTQQLWLNGHHKFIRFKNGLHQVFSQPSPSPKKGENKLSTQAHLTSRVRALSVS